MCSFLHLFRSNGQWPGYLTIDFTNARKKRFYHGFDKNESNRLYCYYNTNKDTGSEFIVRPSTIPPQLSINWTYPSQTNPKTLGVAVYCPVDLDDETGPFIHQRSMEQGYFCRPLADYPSDVEVLTTLTLSPSLSLSVYISPSDQ